MTADAPLTATPATSCLDVPAHQGVTAAVRITAPRDTPPGEHRVTVTVGDEPIEVPVTVTETCTELDARLKTAGFAAVEARYVRLEGNAGERRLVPVGGGREHGLTTG
ncbi:hypothetical protein AB0M50_14310 [Nonomuraea fuscirosea]|uniref:hypothetical protein n=1 Tax=Nonomuraea fuscirosea TaxID=1291556 RepID=UPI00341CCCA6